MKPDSVLSKLLSRNYHLALFTVVVSAVALFRGKIDGGNWVAVVVGVLGTFRAGDAVVNWLHSKKDDTQ